MEPRLKSSTKWTAIPKEYVQQVKDLLNKTFPEPSKKGRWVFEGRIFPAELLVRMGFIEQGRLKQMNIEVSIGYRAGKDKVTDLLNVAVDVAASLLEQALASESADEFPKIWTEYEVEKYKVFVQYSGVNTDLEAEADRLLGVGSDGSLVAHQDLDDEDEELLKEIKRNLGLDPDELPDDDDESPPRKH